MSDTDQQVIDNRFEYAGNGVLAVGATAFLVARNVVYRTSSDGIHVSHDAFRDLNSKDGRIVCNVVRETGDDMIAIVNYGIGEPKIGNFLIEGNDVSGNYSGRGISVVGGRDVTIRRNHIAATALGAGVLIASEEAYYTSDVRNILVEENNIVDVQATDPIYSLLARQPVTGQGGIDVNCELHEQKCSQVMIKSNTVTRAIRDGIFVRGNAQQISLVDNRTVSVGRAGIRIEADPDATVFCSGNTQDGAPTTDPRCTIGSTSVTGADLSF
jgi:hypothetical protein